MGTSQFSVRVDDEVLEQLDKFVDGIHYRSRAQITAIALIDWLQDNGANLSVLDLTCVPRQEDEIGYKQIVTDQRRFKAMLKDALREMAESGELPEELKPRKGKKR